LHKIPLGVLVGRPRADVDSCLREVANYGSAHHHVDLAAAATGTDELFAPFENGNLGAVAARMQQAYRLKPGNAYLTFSTATGGISA